MAEVLTSLPMEMSTPEIMPMVSQTVKESTSGKMDQSIPENLKKV